MTDIKDIILGTGNYNNVKCGNTVSITGDGGNAWEYYGPSYKKIAPRLKTYLNYANKYQELLKIKDKNEYKLFRKEIEDEYIKSYYETRLKELDVYELLDTLYNRLYSKPLFLQLKDGTDERLEEIIKSTLKIPSGHTYRKSILINYKAFSCERIFNGQSYEPFKSFHYERQQNYYNIFDALDNEDILLHL